MKKLKRSLIATTLALLSIGATACGASDTGKKTTIEDSVAPVISGAETVRIDLSTEKLSLYDGITAIDKDDKGNETDLTEEVKATIPADATLADGEVTFNKAGDYNIVYSVKDAAGNTSSVSRKVEVRNIYNLYWMSATLPVLYCALDMVTNDYKSMLIFTRTDTIDIDELDKDRFIYVLNGAGTSHLEQAKARLGRIANSDPYSYFRMFTVDARNQIELFTFPLYGITEDRYEVKLVSDGSWTYNSAFPYRENGSISTWNSKKETYYAIMDEALRGKFTYNADGYTLTAGGVTAKSGIVDSQLVTMTAIAAQRDNVELWCAYPETLTSADTEVAKELAKCHMPKMAPDKMYRDLTDEQRAKFLKIVNFDKNEFDKEYFSSEGQYLIVTGTNPVNGSLSKTAFFAILDQIASDFNGYNILFKPHPSAIPTQSKDTDVYNKLMEMGVKILPGKLPMEVISWCYPDVSMGGFDSSLYMSVPQGNVKFFIANGADSLSELSKQLYNDGAFGQPKFYWEAQSA